MNHYEFVLVNQSGGIYRVDVTYCTSPWSLPAILEHIVAIEVETNDICPNIMSDILSGHFQNVPTPQQRRVWFENTNIDANGNIGGILMANYNTSKQKYSYQL